ncbi:MAG: ATP-binding protein [Thermoplasmata archaeon]|nr:ATP-binding protein [Thermoplasmata archaeon]
MRSPGWTTRLSAGLLASDDEAAALLPPPWAPLPWSAPPADGLAGRPVALGTGTSGVEVGLPWSATEGRHLLLLGESGMGKSTLLVRLGLDVARRHVAVVLLDPIGDTADAFLQALGPRELDRTTLIAPESMPIGINALAPSGSRGTPAAQTERTLNDLVTALRRVRAQRFPETPFWGPRIEETVHRALSAAAAWPDGTIALGETLLDPSAHGRNLAPPEARAFVDELRAWVADRPEEVEGSRRLLGEVTRNRWLRQLLCDPDPRWQIARATAPGAITVISGEASLVGESTARYLLAVYLALLWPSVIARGDPAKIVLLADEAQLFAHESLAEMLRLGRRYNLHVWAATQSLDALPDPVAEAFRTNAADMVLFRGSPAEAREIGRWNPSVVASELLGLPRGWSLALIGKGERVETISTSAVTSAGSAERLREWTRARRSELRGTPEASASVSGGAEREAPHGDPSRAADEGVGVDSLLDLFAVGLAPLPSGAEGRLSLHRLRATLGVADAVIRSTGSELQRLGALLGSGRDAQGGFWRIDRDRLCSQRRELSDPKLVAHLRAMWSALHDE